MKVAVHQPQYFPWSGYFDKMDQADVFVVLDDVQYKKNEWQNRNKIRTADEWQWLTVPVEYSFGQKILDVTIDNRNRWNEKHIKSLNVNYSKSEYFEMYFKELEKLLNKEWINLAELNIAVIYALKSFLGIDTQIIKSSDMVIKGRSTQRLVDICKELKADTYISGPGGKDYLEEDLFAGNGILLEYQKYEHPVYKQLYGGFYPYMSVIDLLFCAGQESLSIIRKGRSL